MKTTVKAAAPQAAPRHPGPFPVWHDCDPGAGRKLLAHCDRLIAHYEHKLAARSAPKKSKRRAQP